MGQPVLPVRSCPVCLVSERDTPSWGIPFLQRTSLALSLKCAPRRPLRKWWHVSRAPARASHRGSGCPTNLQRVPRHISRAYLKSVHGWEWDYLAPISYLCTQPASVCETIHPPSPQMISAAWRALCTRKNRCMWTQGTSFVFTTRAVSLISTDEFSDSAGFTPRFQTGQICSFTTVNVSS